MISVGWDGLSPTQIGCSRGSPGQKNGIPTLEKIRFNKHSRKFAKYSDENEGAENQR